MAKQIPVTNRASQIEYAIRDVVVPASVLEAQGHEIIKLNKLLEILKTKKIGQCYVYYKTRSYEEGKKCTWEVGFFALRRIVLDRFFS